MSYSLSIKLTPESKKIRDKLCLIDWSKLEWPEDPRFRFCFKESPVYGLKKSFGFDYSGLPTEQRVPLHNFVKELSMKCGQNGFYYYDQEKVDWKLNVENVWDKDFISLDLYNKWVKFFDNLMELVNK